MKPGREGGGGGGRGFLFAEVPNLPIFPEVSRNFMQAPSLLNFVKFSQMKNGGGGGGGEGGSLQIQFLATN